MKIIVSTALIAAQLVAAQPAFAAEIQRETTAATGAFGGLRLRVPLGGDPARRAPRLGLALAPTVHNVNEDGAVRMRIGEGMEFGFSGGRTQPALSIAGRRIGDYRPRAGQDNGQGNDGDNDRGGISTGEALLIAGGVIVLAVVATGIWFVSEINSTSD